MSSRIPKRGAPAAHNRDDVLQTMLNHVAQGVAIFDRDYRLVGWNRQFQEIVDLPDAVLSGSPSFHQLVGLMAERGDFGCSPGNIDGAVRELTTSLDAPHVAERMLPDGRVLETRRTPRPGGGLLVVYTDVTEQRHAEYLIQERERGIRSILDKAPVALAVIGQMDGEIRHVNARFRKLFAVGEKTLVQDIDLSRHMAREDWDRLLSTPLRAGSIDFETTVRRTGGDEFWALISPVRFIFEWAPAVLVGFYDITDRRRAEAGLRDELERKYAELNDARTLQLELVPPDFVASIANYNIRIEVVLEPAKEVGGDLVDHFRIGDNRLALILGDVSHKGARAALFMARTHSLIRAIASRPDAAALFHQPAEVVRLLNAALCRDNATCMFITLLLATFDAESGELVYVRAGHVPPFVRRAAGKIERLSVLGGPPLGLVESGNYESASVVVHRGDQILLVTDGFAEATDPSGAQFGNARLEAFLAVTGPDAAAPLKRLVTDLRTFEAGQQPFDDIAAILFTTA